jgi:hypothetical protein
MFHHKQDSIHGRPAELRTHIKTALKNGALTTVEIAWHIAVSGKYPTCAGEVGALLGEDPSYECDKKGQWRLRK